MSQDVDIHSQDHLTFRRDACPEHNKRIHCQNEWLTECSTTHIRPSAVCNRNRLPSDQCTQSLLQVQKILFVHATQSIEDISFTFELFTLLIAYYGFHTSGVRLCCWLLRIFQQSVPKFNLHDNQLSVVYQLGLTLSLTSCLSLSMVTYQMTDDACSSINVQLSCMSIISHLPGSRVNTKSQALITPELK